MTNVAYEAKDSIRENYRLRHTVWYTYLTFFERLSVYVETLLELCGAQSEVTPPPPSPSAS
jgi:hypothetical protein